MNQSGRPLIFAVLGGAGSMGRITVRDLIETTPLGTEVLIADYNLPAGKKLAREMGPKARAIKVDVTQVGATAKALKGVFAAVNACRHDFNVDWHGPKAGQDGRRSKEGSRAIRSVTERTGMVPGSQISSRREGLTRFRESPLSRLFSRFFVLSGSGCRTAFHISEYRRGGTSLLAKTFYPR
jgi:Saccharopine dehydrogenase NADP binding domain